MGLKNIFISRNLKKVKRKVQFHNFETAKKIGLLYPVNDAKTDKIVKNYAEELTNFDIKTLGFVFNPEQIGNPYLGQSNSHYFTEKHFSKLGKIKETCISDFINNEFDILINLSQENNFFIDYVFGLSKAHFKVSGIENCKYSDFNIDKSKNLDDFISQVNKYLNIIKKA